LEGLNSLEEVDFVFVLAVYSLKEAKILLQVRISRLEGRPLEQGGRICYGEAGSFSLGWTEFLSSSQPDLHYTGRICVWVRSFPLGETVYYCGGRL
jgi:hypothetical protein